MTEQDNAHDVHDLRVSDLELRQALLDFGEERIADGASYAANLAERIKKLESKLAGELAVLDGPVRFEQRLSALEAALAKQCTVNEVLLAWVEGFPAPDKGLAPVADALHEALK